MITIDGSQGEGGGQIVRSALALSLVTGRPITIEKVRAGRQKPGLLRQHLTAVRAAREICDARTTGAELGSNRLVFVPGEVKAGEYRFDVGSAGSTTLVFQTVLPALMLAPGNSQIEILGGTHNPFAPPFEFLTKAYLPVLCKLGAMVEAGACRPGFYPAGGGSVRMHVVGGRQLLPLELLERGPLVRREVRALVANLPRHIGERECKQIAKKTDWDLRSFVCDEVHDASGPGNAVMIELAFEGITELFAAFGEVGKRAERVANEALRAALQYLASDVPVGPYLADQLLLPMGIAAAQGHPCVFRTGTLTQHALTHIDVLHRLLDIRIDVEEQAGSCLVRLLRREPSGASPAGRHRLAE